MVKKVTQVPMRQSPTTRGSQERQLRGPVHQLPPDHPGGDRSQAATHGPPRGGVAQLAPRVVDCGNVIQQGGVGVLDSI